MSISSEVRRAGPYSGNGSTTAFAFAFKVFTTAQVVVTRTVSGVETTLTLTTHYTVTLNSNQNTNPGGTVTMLTAPATGQSITITSNVANLQPTAIANLGGFYPEVINDSLDRATIQIQQLDERLDRALVIPVSSSGVSTQLPVPEASKILGWNGAGTAVINYTTLPPSGEIYPIATYAALTATPVANLQDDMLFYVASRSTENDGGAGVWRYDAASTATADGDTILAIDGGGAGRFFCLSSMLSQRRTWKSNNLLFNLATNTQATLLDFTTSADVTVAASKQADLIYYGDTYDIGSGGIVHLMNANVTAKSTSHSSSNLRGPTITITNNGPGTTTGMYPRAIAGVGCTGNIIAIKSGVQTRTGIAAAYTRQITNDTDTSGTVEALDWWTSNTATATTANYGLLADVKLSVATSFIQYASVGAGAFLTQKNSTAAADLFKISSAGIITECKGATFNGAVTMNTSLTMSSQVSQAYSNGTREFQAQAVTTGDFWRILVGGVGDGLKLFATGLLDILGSVRAHYGTAIPAGGTAGAGLLVSSTSNFGVFFGSGAPTLAAAQGSLYLRSDGSSTSNRAYINTDGGTTWTALTTAA
jgi:hypothetical protein